MGFHHSWCLIFINMVDIHSIAASSHPSHREQETEREVTSRSRARRSSRDGCRSSATTAATATQRHRSARTVKPPPTVNVGTTLTVAHQLLNNPPSAHASPSTVEHWRMGGVWYLHHSSGWWSGHTSFDPIYRRSMTRQ
jgi:hypothetical protein